jgi:uncharacterized repeat protein (TIGR04138 family)
MTPKKVTLLADLVKHVDRYPEGAFLFVREGLAHATRRIHGPESPAHEALQEYLQAHDLDWTQGAAQFDAGALPGPLGRSIQEAGGWEKMNRHVSGRELCWGLRDYALDRWGLMARSVLDSWNIRETADFGRIVFGFIEFQLMQKQPNDSIDDFVNVFDFSEAFEKSFRACEDPIEEHHDSPQGD